MTIPLIKKREYNEFFKIYWENYDNYIKRLDGLQYIFDDMHDLLFNEKQRMIEFEIEYKNNENMYNIIEFINRQIIKLNIQYKKENNSSSKILDSITEIFYYYKHSHKNLDALKINLNIYVNGPAGCGKTYFVNRYLMKLINILFFYRFYKRKNLKNYQLRIDNFPNTTNNIEEFFKHKLLFKAVEFDECYQILRNKSISSILMKFLDDCKSLISIIFIGYKTNELIEINPGFERRILHCFTFNDLNAEEFYEKMICKIQQNNLIIFDKKCLKKIKTMIDQNNLLISQMIKNKNQSAVEMFYNLLICKKNETNNNFFSEDDVSDVFDRFNTRCNQFSIE